MSSIEQSGDITYYSDFMMCQSCLKKKSRTDFRKTIYIDNESKTICMSVCKKCRTNNDVQNIKNQFKNIHIDWGPQRSEVTSPKIIDWMEKNKS